MISGIDKMVVAESCGYFKSKSTEVIASFRNSCQGCTSCANYLDGSCRVDAYESILNNIKLN